MLPDLPLMLIQLVSDFRTVISRSFGNGWLNAVHDDDKAAIINGWQNATTINKINVRISFHAP
jgi:SH3-like domain-containing protein